MTTRDEAMKTKPTLKASNINKDTTRHPAFDEHFSIADTVDKEHSFWCSKAVFCLIFKYIYITFLRKYTVDSLCVSMQKQGETIQISKLSVPLQLV